MEFDLSARLEALPLGKMILSQAVDSAASKLAAMPADIPGLWFAAGFPELTTNQLLELAARK